MLALPYCRCHHVATLPFHQMIQRVPCEPQVLLHQFKELEDQRTVLGSGLSDKAVLHLKQGGTVRSSNNLIMGGLRR